MNIQALYDELDELEGDARSTAEDFAMTGDLSDLRSRLSSFGSRAYTLADAVSQIVDALKLGE